MKPPVWQKFDAVAARYDNASFLQQQAAQHLLQLIGQVAPQSIWLDAGCGTGILSRALAQQGAQVWAVDMAPNMLHFLAGKAGIFPLQADIAQLPMADHSIRGVVSNFALHWLGSRCLSELLRVLEPEGQAWLAIPVQGSLSEVSSRYAGFPVFEFEPVAHWLTQAHDSVVQYEVRPYSQPFACLRALLGAIRTMGGDQTGHPALRPQLSVWREWLRDDKPIDLTFNVLFMQLKKPLTQG